MLNIACFAQFMTASLNIQVLILCLLIFGFLPKASADLEYRFHWGRVSIAEFSLTLPTPEERKIRLEGETVGLVGAFMKYDGAIEADYSDMSGVLFRVSGEDNGFEEYRTIKFPSDSPAEILEFLDDELDEPPSELVESMGVTVDPLRVVLTLLDASNTESSSDDFCKGSFSVFDGKRHYQLGLIAGESEILEADRSWTYSGEVQRCDLSVSYLQAAGGEEQNPWYEEDSETRTIWLAEMENSLVPVKVRMPAPIGKITGRLYMPQAHRHE